MGVDFFPCAYCKETICDCGDWIRCENCGRKFHDLECGGIDPDDYDGDGYNKCRYCSGDDVTNDQLLEFFLKKKKITKEQLKEMYFDEFKKQK